MKIMHHRAFLTLVLIAAFARADSSRLAVIRKAPDFTLTTEQNAPFRFADMRGKVVLVSFIFTTCSGTCPATTHRMAQIQKELQTRNLLRGDKVQLLSITLDPARDTPEVLRNYMQLYDVDSAHWHFLTSSRDAVAKVIADWGMWVRSAANGQLDHPSRVFLIDPRGQIREIYDLNFLKAPWVADDIGLLLREN